MSKTTISTKRAVPREVIIRAAISLEKRQYIEECRQRREVLETKIQDFFAPYLMAFIAGIECKVISRSPDGSFLSPNVPGLYFQRELFSYDVESVGRRFVKVRGVLCSVLAYPSGHPDPSRVIRGKLPDVNVTGNNNHILLYVTRNDYDKILAPLRQELNKIPESSTLLQASDDFWRSRVIDKLGLKPDIKIQVRNALMDPEFNEAVTALLNKRKNRKTASNT